MRRILLAFALLWAGTASAGQVPNPLNAPSTITPGHVVCGNGGQNVIDCGVPGAGNVTGPGSAVNSNFAQFNGTTGAVIKDGAAAELRIVNYDAVDGLSAAC